MGRAYYSSSRLVSWTLVRRCALAGTYWYGTTAGALYYYGGKFGFVLRLLRCSVVVETIGGDVVSYSRVRRCPLLQWCLAKRGSGRQSTGSLEGPVTRLGVFLTLPIVWAIASREFGDETGGIMGITTCCSWLIAVVGTFLLYSWAYIQSFGIYIFGYASIRYYGFLELLSRNVTKYEDYRSISSTCSNGVTLERQADCRVSYGGL